MTKIKGILTIGVILLFLGVTFNPVTAQTNNSRSSRGKNGSHEHQYHETIAAHE